MKRKQCFLRLGSFSLHSYIRWYSVRKPCFQKLAKSYDSLEQGRTEVLRLRTLLLLLLPLYYVLNGCFIAELKYILWLFIRYIVSHSFDCYGCCTTFNTHIIRCANCMEMRIAVLATSYYVSLRQGVSTAQKLLII